MMCRICRTSEADSREHLFPSAIGGRLRVPNVLCTKCNGDAGHTIDDALTKAFEVQRMMLAIVGDRGQTASVRTVDQAGRPIILDPGALLRAPEGPPEPDGEGTAFASRHAARKYVAAMMRKNPDRRVEITMARRVKTFPAPAQLNLPLGGDDFYRSSLKTILVLIADRGLDVNGALDAAWQCVSGGKLHECGVTFDVSAAPAPWDDVDTLGIASHRVAIVANAGRGVISADVRYFGDFGVCARIAAPVTSDYRIGYGIDPISGRSREFDDWTGAIAWPNAAEHIEKWKARERALYRIRDLAVDIGLRKLCEQVVRDALRRVRRGVPEDSPVTPAQLNEIGKLVSEDVLRILYREDGSEDAPELADELARSLGLL
jgi:hypothetical protein